MRSLTAGLARQAAVAAAMGALLFAALVASPSSDRRPPTVSASFDKPIPTRAIVIAEAPPTLAAQPAKAATNSKLAMQAPKPAATAHTHLAASPRPRPADPAPQVVAADFVAPGSEPQPPFDFRKRLFAPVGFVRDNVARLVSWL